MGPGSVMRRLIHITAAACLVACDPGLPTDDKDDTQDTPVDTDRPDTVDPTDTAPTPPCTLPESEPNNGLDLANALPMDVQACGVFDLTTDADFWVFDMVEEGWVGVDVDAFAIGSDANVSLSLSSGDGQVAFGISQFTWLPDVRVRFPSPPDSYTAIVRQVVGESATAGQGEDYFYDLRATSTKPPLDWDLVEDANEARTSPHRIVVGTTGPGGKRVFGTAESAADQDWFRIDVPSGSHRVTLDVDAHAFGSVGDFALRRVDGSGTVLETRTRGEVSADIDAWMQFDVSGPEAVIVQVLEEDAHHGRPFWYTLRVDVEAR